MGLSVMVHAYDLYRLPCKLCIGSTTGKRKVFATYTRCAPHSIREICQQPGLSGGLGARDRSLAVSDPNKNSTNVREALIRLSASSWTRLGEQTVACRKGDRIDPFGVSPECFAVGHLATLLEMEPERRALNNRSVEVVMSAETISHGGKR